MCNIIGDFFHFLMRVTTVSFASSGIGKLSICKKFK